MCVCVFVFLSVLVGQVRRLSVDDKAKVKAFSIENDNTSWLKKKLFKKASTASNTNIYISDCYCNVVIESL